MATSGWRIEVPRSAASDLTELPDSVREEALEIIDELGENPVPPEAKPVRKYRNRFKIKFYGFRYRLIYEVSRQQKKVIVGRIRVRDPKTYSGMDKW